MHTLVLIKYLSTIKVQLMHHIVCIAVSTLLEATLVGLSMDGRLLVTFLYPLGYPQLCPGVEASPVPAHRKFGCC